MINKQKREKEEWSKEAKIEDCYQVYNLRSVAGLKISIGSRFFFLRLFSSFPFFFPLFSPIHTDSAHVNATQTVTIYYHEKCFDLWNRCHLLDDQSPGLSLDVTPWPCQHSCFYACGHSRYIERHHSSTTPRHELSNHVEQHISFGKV